MRRHLTRYAAVSAALVVLLAVIVFGNDVGHFNTDIKPEVYLDPWTMVGRYLSSWTATPYLGSANFNVGLVPVLLVLSVLRALGLSPEWTFKVFHLALWLVAAWGANRLTRAAAPRAGRYLGLAAGVFYLANPYAVAGGNTLAIALPMAFLPWMLLAFLRSLEQPRSWAWPAAFGLTFFAMSGMNVAVVPLFQLLGIVPLAAVARWHHHRSWREIVAVTAKCALFVLLLSLYWLVPAVSALGAGTQIVDQSETLDGIHKVSSFTEVLRGLGLWPLYGQSDTGPWVPQDAVYLTSVPVVLLTGLWPALSILALRWARTGVRRAVALTMALAAVVMVGLFPGQHRPESPLGWLLKELLSAPGLAAFRTTNKIGALLALGCAVALAGGLVLAARTMRDRGPLRPVAAALTAVVVAAWVLPALAGGLYTSRMDIPGYWKKAAAAADEGSPHASVLVLPGQTRPTYRWTVQRPDDLTNSLMRRNAVIPETSPNASLPGANFLAALDDSVQEGTAGGNTVSTFARYLGADTVLMRHDTVWEADGGARPAQTSALMGGDGNLFGKGNFGRPGQNVVAPDAPSAGGAENFLTPVQLYGVRAPRDAVRAESTKGQLIVAGDGWAFPQMQDAGLLRTSPVVRYALDEKGRSLDSALEVGAHLVITDTNARRTAIPQRLTANEGALLAADEAVKDTRTLGTSPTDQTVLVRSGTTVHTTSSGGTFFDMPYATGENAFDGDPDTSWRFGDFGRGVGQRITLRFPSRQTLHDVSIAQPDLGPAHIGRATMRAGGKTQTIDVPTTGKGTFHMGGVNASEVSVTVDSLAGSGYNLVGISELGLPGPKAGRAARTPQTFTRQYSALDRSARQAFDRTPLDVLLTRVTNTSSPQDDSETGLHRIVSMPDDRRFDVSAAVRVAPGALETVYDRSAGLDTSTAVTSSDYYFDNPDDRASKAVTGGADSGWIPGGTMKGSWWQWAGGHHDVSAVSITQKPGSGSAQKTLWARRVSVLVDGKRVTSSDLKPNGTTKIDLHGKRHAGSVRVVIDDTSGPSSGAPAAFTAIDAGFKPGTTRPGPMDRSGQNRCLPVATVDGHDLLLRMTGSRLADERTAGTRWTSCGPVTLRAGDRHIDEKGPFILDSMNLVDHSARHTPPAIQPAVSVKKDTATAKTLEVGPSATPVAVVIGQSFDSRWHAHAGGKDLGPATTIDGFSTGWILPPGPARTVSVTFGPQRAANIALVITLLALIGAGVLVAGLWRHRGRRPAGAHRTEIGDRARRIEAARRRGDRRVVREVSLVLLATFCVGLPGLVAAAGVVVFLRRREVSSRHLVSVGAALVFAGMALFCLVNPSPSRVSADAISANLWPHRLAAAGLVVGLAGLVRRSGGANPSREDER